MTIERSAERVEMDRLLEENEQLRNEMKLMIPLHEASAEHQKLKARIDAAMDLLATRHTSNPQCYYCRELIAERAEIRKALRGEK